MSPEEPIRICEHGTHETRNRLQLWQRDALEEAAARWKEHEGIDRLPLTWEGNANTILRASHYVGVIEAGGVVVEIYPKLDRKVLKSEMVGDDGTSTVLRNLLWMLETAQPDRMPDSDTGNLNESPQSYAELWAWLLGRALLTELRRGRYRAYLSFADDLHTVRGRLDFRAQATRLAGRHDKLACCWDELTADMVINQTVKSACAYLRTRIRGYAIIGLLENCLALLDDVEAVAPSVAIRRASTVTHWHRGAERFRAPFALALRLLKDVANELQSGQAESFVFLLDMHTVWEEYVGALLREIPGVRVETQKRVGYLLSDLPHGRIEQRADYLLQSADGGTVIGDAKYKHLTAEQDHPLRFADSAHSDGQRYGSSPVSIDDIRQLTTYAELAFKNGQTCVRPDLWLLYPYVGKGELAADTTLAWNGSRLSLVPVGVDPVRGRRGNLPDMPSIR